MAIKSFARAQFGWNCRGEISGLSLCEMSSLTFQPVRRVLVLCPLMFWCLLTMGGKIGNLDQLRPGSRVVAGRCRQKDSRAARRSRAGCGSGHSLEFISARRFVGLLCATGAGNQCPEFSSRHEAPFERTFPKPRILSECDADTGQSHWQRRDPGTAAAHGRSDFFTRNGFGVGGSSRAGRGL